MATPVLFRIDIDSGECVAVMPQLPGTYDRWTMTSYVHQGQHGACSLDWYRSNSRRALPSEYAPLQRELMRQGYDDLIIRQRISEQDHKIRFLALDNR